MSNNSLQNINNYNLNYINSTTEIFTKYIGLITEYIVQIIDVIYIKNNTYYKYIINKGIETLSHVFKFIMLYTKNLEITYFYGQKAFYYYTEFIGQIIQIEHEHQSFLQLNCKDASLFVYKKTIFELNNEFKKEFTSIYDNCYITDSIDILITFYKKLIFSIIDNSEFDNKSRVNLLTDINNKLNKIIIYLLNLSLNIDNQEYFNKLNLILYFYDNLKINNINKLNLLECFLKKIVKYPITKEIINNKFNNINNEDKLKNLQNNKYINWLFEH